jgi:hypothetical protein
MAPLVKPVHSLRIRQSQETNSLRKLAAIIRDTSFRIRSPQDLPAMSVLVSGLYYVPDSEYGGLQAR